MASKYQKPYSIPEGFPALLKAFTREILRSQVQRRLREGRDGAAGARLPGGELQDVGEGGFESKQRCWAAPLPACSQPDNIYEFGAQYFANLQSEGPQDAPADEEATNTLESDLQRIADTVDVTKMSTSELEPIIMGLFIEADADGSGYLDRHEFANVLSSAHLKLTERQIREVLAEADENDDDVIEYREFVPFMVDILHGMKATENAQRLMQQAETIVREAVEDLLLHGMSKQDLEKLMARIFKKADADGSGKLSRKEFKDCLKAAQLGLTRKDINLIMSRVDLDQDQQISYEEFIPVCFAILVERFKDEIVSNDIKSNHEGLQGLLLEAFQSVDEDGTGMLPQMQVKRVLQELSYQVLGLSSLQLITLLSHAPTTADGMINHLPFVPVAAATIYSMYDVDKIKLRIQAVKEMADSGGIQQMASMDINSLRSTLEQLFNEADVDQTGQLQEEDVMGVLQMLGSQEGLGMSETHARAMFTAVDADENGSVDWVELVTFICDAIEHLERESYIESISGGGN